MKPGVTLAQANAEMTQLVRHYGETASANTHAFRPDRHPVVMYPFQAEVIRTVRPAMIMLLFAVGFVLLIACVNVANLAAGARRGPAARDGDPHRAGRVVRQAGPAIHRGRHGVVAARSGGGTHAGLRKPAV